MNIQRKCLKCTHVHLQALQNHAIAAQHEEHRVQAALVLRVDRLQRTVLPDLGQNAALLHLGLRPRREIFEATQRADDLVPLQLQGVVQNGEEVLLVDAQQFGVDWRAVAGVMVVCAMWPEGKRRRRRTHVRSVVCRNGVWSFFSVCYCARENGVFWVVCEYLHRIES